MLSDQGEMHGHQTAKYTLNRRENCETGMHSKREKAIAPDDFSPGKINWNVLEPKTNLVPLKSMAKLHGKQIIRHHKILKFLNRTRHIILYFWTTLSEEHAAKARRKG